MAKDLGTHDIAALAEVHGRLDKPSNALVNSLKQTADTALDTVSQFYPVPVGPVKAIFEGWRKEKRIQAAAWKWLMPQAAPLLHDSLPSIQERVELNHMHHDAFLTELSSKCSEIAEQMPELGTHVSARRSEIDFRLERVRHAHVLDAEYSNLVVSLTRFASWQHTLTDGEALEEGLGIVKAAIAGICNEVLTTLSPKSERSVLNGNLMIASEYLPPDLVHFGDSGNKLWAGYERWPIHKKLILVCESGASKCFEGFWIPDIRHDGKTLPGAPRAMETGCVERLVCGDLPPFPIPDPEMAQRWAFYMLGTSARTFTFDACVSMPLSTPKGVGATPTNLGAVNVNLKSSGTCERALSRSWRALAQQRSQCWLAVIWPALQIALRRKHVDALTLPSGVHPVLLSTPKALCAEETHDVERLED